MPHTIEIKHELKNLQLFTVKIVCTLTLFTFKNKYYHFLRQITAMQNDGMININITWSVFVASLTGGVLIKKRLKHFSVHQETKINRAYQH